MQDVIGSFIDQKKADSPFITLDDGESIRVAKLVEIKRVLKPGFDGKEKDVLRFICEVETPYGAKVKNFDNGTQRFAAEFKEKGVKIGDAFTLTRVGLQAKTRYQITDLVHPQAGSSFAPKAAPAAAPAPADDIPFGGEGEQA